MSKAKQATFPLKRLKDNFILHLNKDLYRDEVVQEAVKEDKDWIREVPSSDSRYVCLELKTSDTGDVLNWVNYLVYLHSN